MSKILLTIVHVGLKYLVVVINKMDDVTVNYSQERSAMPPITFLSLSLSLSLSLVYSRLSHVDLECFKC